MKSQQNEIIRNMKRRNADRDMREQVEENWELQPLLDASMKMLDEYKIGDPLDIVWDEARQ